jgi:RNA polymerase sigma-70 factor (ECF subfamily)
LANVKYLIHQNPSSPRIPENLAPPAHLYERKVKGADVSGRGMEGLAWESLIEEQIRRNGRLFFRLAYNVLRDSPAAEDVCQQAFLRACEQRQQILHNPAALKAWLVRTVLNGSLEAVRRGKVERRAMQDQARVRAAASVSSPPGGADELRETVLAALGRLPEQTRLVVALRVMEGLAGNEVKELLGCSAAEVSRQLHRGLEQLRGLMVERETDAVG